MHSKGVGNRREAERCKHYIGSSQAMSVKCGSEVGVEQKEQETCSLNHR